MTTQRTKTADEQSEQMKSLASQVVELARKAGVAEAEAFVERSRQASVQVREGEIENLSEASSKGVGLRIIVDGRLGFASTTDFSRETLGELVSRAIALAKETAPDDANELPKNSARQRITVERLFDDAVADIDPGWKVKAAFEIERAARAEDSRCTRFEGSGAGEAATAVAIANSDGLLDAERDTWVHLWCAPVAESDGSLQTASWSDYRRFLSDLESPESVGRTAARRAVRMLGARTVSTTRVPVVFDPLMAGGFFASLASALNGELVYKGSSFLGNSLNQKIGSDLISLVDDPHIPAGLGSGAFDGEGVATSPLTLFESGVVRAFLYDTRTARKAGARSTGHARRSYASLPSIGTSNLRVTPGNQTPEEIIGSIKSGLYVTSMLGRGANVVTGDYSRGANGIWIENGELTFPVQEVTVAGQLATMLQSVDALGNDLTFRGSVGAPTLRFAELAVGGR